MKNHDRIDAKSMLEKGMAKVCKMMPKGSQNGNQNPLKRRKIPENKGMQKMIPKFDAHFSYFWLKVLALLAKGVSSLGLPPVIGSPK